MTIVERSAQVQTIIELRDAAHAATGRFAVVSGGPGIGKSTVLAAFVADCRHRGIATFVAAGGEFEDDLGFGIVRDLIGALAGTRAPLAGAAALAATVFTGEPAVTGATDVASVLHGLHQLVTDACTDEPLVLVVDDVQWSDPASIRFLSYLARRISGLRCLVVLGLRAGARSRVRSDVAALVADVPGARMELPQLSGDGVAALIAAAVGAELSPEFGAACLLATGGNPLLCVLLARELAHRGSTGRADEVAVLRDIGSNEITASVHRRLERRSADAVELARAVAVLGQSASLARAATLAGVPAEGAVAALEVLASDEVLTDTSPLGFTHPILRAAVIGTLSPGALSRLHARAGRLLEADGLDEAAAHHLHLAEPQSDPRVVALLRRVADVAVRRGAPEEAATYLARALAEPPPADLRAEVGYELGRAEAWAGMPSAVGHLQAALDSTDDPDLLAAISLVLGPTHIWAGNFAESMQALDRALEVAIDPDAREALLLQITLAATGSAQARAASLEHVHQLRATGSALPPRLRAVLAVELGMTEGPADEVVSLALSTLKPDLIGGLSVVSGLYEMTAAVLGLAGGAVEAIRALDTAVAHARESGATLMFSRAGTLRGLIHQNCGRPGLARDDVDAVLALGEAGVFNATMLPTAVGVLIDALLDTDGPAAARAAADRYGFVPVGDIDKAASQHLQLALARVSLAERRPETVLAELASCHRWEQEFGRCSVAFAPWRPIAIRARLMLGDQAGAGELAEQLLELSDRFGEGTIRGAARHASALVRADPDLMREAIELLAGSPIRQAEALLDLSLLARARRRLPEARTAMEDALAKAAGAGAGALVERIRVELRASGGRPRRAGAAGVAALTPAELRVVRQAAAGRSNREIAQAVFLSPRTVEMHLSNAYRKLGITERSRLADLIGQLD